jgi:hypothetical protein
VSHRDGWAELNRQRDWKSRHHRVLCYLVVAGVRRGSQCPLPIRTLPAHRPALLFGGFCRFDGIVFGLHIVGYSCEVLRLCGLLCLECVDRGLCRVEFGPQISA